VKTYLQHILNRASCDYAEFRYQETATTRLVFDGEGLKDVALGRARGGFVRVLQGGAFGVASFEELDRASEFLDRALALAKLKPGSFLAFAPAEINVDDVVVDVPRPAHEVDLDEKIALVDKYNELLLRPDRIPATDTTYGDFFERRLFVNTEGAAVSITKPRANLSLRPLASEGGVVQMAIRNLGGLVGFDHFRGREEAVEELAAHAASLLDAEPATGGTYDVITDPLLTGIFAHEAFGHTAEADDVARDDNLREIMQVGRRFGSEIISIVDDGLCEGRNGYVPYDDEGIRGRKKYLLREGVLGGLLHDRETATRLEAEPTGNARALNYRYPPLVRMTATYVEPGKVSFEEMLAGVPRGIYARRAKGGTGGETFTFTAEDGYLIENGRLTTHLRDLKLQGNLFRTLENIVAVADDFEMPEEGVAGCGKWGQSPLPVSNGGPHMLIKNVQIGGR
jgi:TldD protein